MPINIAPLNFDAAVAAERVEATISNGSQQIKVKGRTGVDIPLRKWRALLADAERLTVAVAVTAEGVQTEYAPFEIMVSRDSIDYGVCYRRVDPGYEYYARMGLYYYDLAENEEHILIENTLLGSSCVNCHSFAKTSPSKMMFHIRGKGGGTLMHLNGQNTLLNTKTDATQVSCVYPSWHPEGRYIAYSINDIKQTFHNEPSMLLDVYDHWSDVVIYDTETGELWVNEINTIPGSLSFYLWEAAGLPFDKLLDEMIALALKRQRDREALTFSYESNILSAVSLGGAKGAKGGKA